MINYAVVGAGLISQQAFLPGVGQAANSNVTAIVTGDPGKAKALADRSLVFRRRKAITD